MNTSLLTQIRIPAGNFTSGEVNIGGARTGQIHCDPSWTPASLAFEVAIVSGGTFYPVYELIEDEGGVVSDALLEVLIAAGHTVSLTEHAAAILPATIIRVKSVAVGNPAATVNQVGERILWFEGKA
jgi:hypothetical protein